MKNQDQPFVIDAGLARRMALNAERNPREQFTIYGEATQTRDPITGKIYRDGEYRPESERRESIWNYLSSEQHVELLTEAISTGNFPLKATSEEIELQKSLGRMELRERNIYEYVYADFLQQTNQLVKFYRDRRLDLESIKDARELNRALSRNKRRLKPNRQATYKTGRVFQ